MIVLIECQQKRLIFDQFVSLISLFVSLNSCSTQGDLDYAATARRAVLAGLWSHLAPGVPRQSLSLSQSVVQRKSRFYRDVTVSENI